MKKYLAGAAIATLAFGCLSLFAPRAAAQGDGLPAMPSVGDRLYVEGHRQVPCTVNKIHANWVLCDGTWRNLVTGAAYMIEQRAK